MIRCWNQVWPKDFSRAIHRVCDGLTKYAPPDVEFVDDVKDADIQIVHVVGEGEVPLILRKQNNKTIIFMYCFLTSTSGSEPREYWKDAYKGALLTMSYYDLPTLMKEKYPDFEFSFYRTPVGIETDTFFLDPVHRRSHSVVSTGHVDWAEKIEEWHDAFSFIGFDVVHVGRDFNYSRNFFPYEKISDTEMRKLYNNALYVNGMRVTEGFEAPVVEGTLCGARGVCFDTPNFRYWFNDIALFVPELNDKQDMTDAIITAVTSDEGLRPVTKEQIDYTQSRFAASIVYPNMWKQIMERL
jgi:hypothetical protein